MHADPASVFYAPPVQTVKKGESTRLICQSDIPNTFISWTIPRGSRASISGIIHVASPADQDVYKCNIINLRGNVIHSLYVSLNVESSICKFFILNFTMSLT